MNKEVVIFFNLKKWQNKLQNACLDLQFTVFQYLKHISNNLSLIVLYAEMQTIMML